MFIRPNTTASEDTGQLTILIDDHEVGEVPGDALGNDPLQGQTSSVVDVGIWDYCGQLLTKLHCPLQDTEEINVSIKSHAETLMRPTEFRLLRPRLELV